MNIPKVEFSLAPINKTFPIIHSFLNPEKGDWNWSGRILRNYPQLRNKLKGVKNKKKRKEIEYNFFKEIFQKKRTELEKRVKIFQKEWNKINDKVMIVLSEIVEQEWPKNDKQISARVSMNPICPRFIKQRTFDVFYKQTPKFMESVAIHEIFHFIYFEKWKKVFPKTKEKEFDCPRLVWHLSEMVPGIILNDKKVQKIFKYKFGSYDIYEKHKLNGKPVLYYLQRFYNNKSDFADFLKKSWKFVKKYEKEIKNL
jgi:hypothetical protein